jgi:hypothetical protein
MYRRVLEKMVIEDVKNKQIAYVNTGIGPCLKRYNLNALRIG